MWQCEILQFSPRTLKTGFAGNPSIVLQRTTISGIHLLTDTLRTLVPLRNSNDGFHGYCVMVCRIFMALGSASR